MKSVSNAVSLSTAYSLLLSIADSFFSGISSLSDTHEAMQTYFRELANFPVQTDQNKKGKSWIKNDRVYFMELVYRQMSSQVIDNQKSNDKPEKARKA